jgi:FtsH-binding integral membrane protein
MLRNLVRPFQRSGVIRSSKVHLSFLADTEEQQQRSTIGFKGSSVPAAAYQSFLSKTFDYSGVGIVTTLALATTFSNSPITITSPGTVALGGFVLSLAGLVGINKGKYQIDHVNQTTTNDPLRLTGLAALVTGVGISSSPAFALYDLTAVLPPSLLMTTLIFSGASFYAKKTKPGSLSKFGPALTGGLFGLVGTGVVALGAELMLGPNMFSALAHNVDLYVGIPLFTGFVAYDTNIARQRFEMGDPDHLGCSVSLYLDFINILMRMMELMGNSRNKHNTRI